MNLSTRRILRSYAIDSRTRARPRRFDWTLNLFWAGYAAALIVLAWWVL